MEYIPWNIQNDLLYIVTYIVFWGLCHQLLLVSYDPLPYIRQDAIVSSVVRKNIVPVQ